MNLAVKEYPPVHELSPFIETLWMGTFNVSADPHFSQKVVPNGCIELILHFSDDHCLLNKSGEHYSKSPPYLLLGVYSKPYIVKFPARVHALGIRFFPDGFRNIFGIPPGAFFSTYEDGNDVVGKKLEEFFYKIQEAQTAEQKIQLANRLFLQQLTTHQNRYDRTHLAMKLIRSRNGLLDFKLLTDHIPISLRQLQREFKNTYGITITDYMRISRLNAIHKYMLTHSASLTELAHQLEFTDQSHFIREFKHYMGLAPKKFIKDKTQFIVNAV